MKAHKWWETALVAAMVAAFMTSAHPRSLSAPSVKSIRRAPAQKASAPFIALTFDDGPSPEYTPEILRLLTRYHAHATFFVLGSEAAQFPHIVRNIVKQGSVVANHGYRHVNYFSVGVAGVERDAARTEELLKKEKIPTVPFYRPPFGNSNKRLVTAMSREGYTLTLWDIDTRDWSMPGTSFITRKVLSHAKSGAIVLMHDGGGNRTQTVRALAAILPVLESEGYRFVTLPQYVKDMGLKSPPKLPLPKPTQPSPTPNSPPGEAPQSETGLASQ